MKQNIFLLTLTIILIACSTDDRLDRENDFGFESPQHFPPPTYNFERNPITKEGFDLGKKLFHDPILSIDNSISCASCHHQSLAFADVPQHPQSIGVRDRIGTRNAPPLFNLAYTENFMWDGGIIHLDFVPIFAIESEVEMNESLENVLEKLRIHEEYPRLFKQAFPQSDEINSARLFQALSQFMNTMVSGESPYDKYLLGRQELSADELDGMHLFEKHCASCHSGILFTNQSFMNNGLDTVFSDPGRALITGLDTDLGKFRVPTLRNIARTPPYMHDGRFRTLEDVLQHYSNEVKYSPSLAPELIDKEDGLGIPLTVAEQKKLIAFLHTLTDMEFIQNPKFRRE